MRAIQCCEGKFVKTLQRNLAERTRRVIAETPLTHAAVLIPLYEKDGNCHILLTKRTQQVRHHKGQISFPGGVFDKKDDGLEGTALREAHEEIGLEEKDARIIGMLDDIVTVTGFVVTPFVGTIPYPYPFRPSPIEIEELIEVPLSHLLDIRFFREEMMEDEHGKRLIYTYQYGKHAIWGATALILKQLLELLPSPGG